MRPPFLTDYGSTIRTLRGKTLRGYLVSLGFSHKGKKTKDDTGRRCGRRRAFEHGSSRDRSRRQREGKIIMDEKKEKRSIVKAVITEELAGQTMDFVAKALGVSSRDRQKVVRTQGLFLDGKKVHSKKTVREHQIVELRLPLQEQVKVTPKEIALSLLYEDERLLVLNKEAGMEVYPTKNKAKITVVEAVASYYAKNSIPHTPRLVHRLDKNTSGVLLIAKTNTCQRELMNLWPDVKKEYLAVVEGLVTEKGCIEVPIEGKEAKTEFTPCGYVDGYTALQVILHTGRTHQIRLHLAHLGHPLLGDTKYNPKGRKSAHLGLHCYQITLPPSFPLPIPCFRAPLPVYLSRFKSTPLWE